jgi:hypothetical protein
VFAFPDVFHLLPNKFPCLRRWGFACSLRLAGALDSLILWHNLSSPQLQLPVVFLKRYPVQTFNIVQFREDS